MIKYINTVIKYSYKFLLLILIFSGLFCTLVGIITVYHWTNKPIPPSDKSNRINNIQSWWIGLTRPEVLAHSYRLYQNDVYYNMVYSNNGNDSNEKENSDIHSDANEKE